MVLKALVPEGLDLSEDILHELCWNPGEHIPHGANPAIFPTLY